MSSLSLFPVRLPIGMAKDANGKDMPVLMTPEFSRALSSLFNVANQQSDTPSTEIESMAIAALTLQAFETDTQGQVLDQLFNEPSDRATIDALREEVNQLRNEVAMLSPDITVAGQLEDLRVTLAMQVEDRQLIKGIITGSRGGNVALASLLTALAKTGLVIDNTVP